MYKQLKISFWLGWSFFSGESLHEGWIHMNLWNRNSKNNLSFTYSGCPKKFAQLLVWTFLDEDWGCFFKLAPKPCPSVAEWTPSEVPLAAKWSPIHQGVGYTSSSKFGDKLLSLRRKQELCISMVSQRHLAGAAVTALIHQIKSSRRRRRLLLLMMH